MQGQLSIRSVSLMAVVLSMELFAQAPKELSPLGACCDAGLAENTWCGASRVTVKDPNHDCDDIYITARQCVERTRSDYHPCGDFKGARWCVDTDAPQPGVYYPRYYAVWEPIQVSPNSLSFTAQYGSSNPPSQAFLILNGVSDVRLLRT